MFHKLDNFLRFHPFLAFKNWQEMSKKAKNDKKHYFDD